MENPLEQNDTDMREEPGSIAPASKENSKASRENFEDASSA